MRAQGFAVTRLTSERGIALITTLLVMMLMSALLVGFTTIVMSDQRYRLIGRDRVRSFYAAHSGLEKLNTDLSNLFLNNVAPTAAQIDALKNDPPGIPDVTFLDSGDAAYGVRLVSTPAPSPISTGPYQGLVALKKIYQLDASDAPRGDGDDSRVPVRRLLRRRPQLPRRPELQLRRPRPLEPRPLSGTWHWQHADAPRARDDRSRRHPKDAGQWKLDLDHQSHR
jgi:hypothetical protein